MTIEKIDKYEILEQIGRGGMGAVYKALHPHFRKYVAIKEIRSDLANNPEIRHLFEQEVELLARLPPHPNIVPVRDAFVWQGRLYVVMDYIDGGTLADLAQQGGVEPEYGATLLDQILAGLEAIHRRDIVHRDLKASNILIDREGAAYISDFGIAECAGISTNSTAMASAKYVAPELIEPALGRTSAKHQVDIYAAGMVAYEMLLGENRFRETFHEVYNRGPDGTAERWLDWHTDFAHAASNLNALDSTIPKPLANVIEQMMAKDLKERYRDASEARRDLAAGMLGHQDARSRRPGPPDDDATVPIDRMRGAGGKASRPVASQPTPLQSSQRRPTSPRARRSQAPAPTPTPQGVQTDGALRRVPRWAWIAGGGAALLVAIVLMVSFLLLGSPGFTMIVAGAPSGSEVYVDGVRRGFPTADGNIIAPGLEARSRRVRVTHDGYEPFETSVVGKDGLEERVSVRMKATDTKMTNEIDYNGPMVLIPKGDFTLGDDNHGPEEKPAQNLFLPDYYIDKFEVTNAQYKKFCQATGRQHPTNPWWDEGYYDNYPNSPVLGIEYDDAVAYANWAGKRLPKEEEWEKAASWDPSASKKRMWPWGDNPDPGRGLVGLKHTSPRSQNSVDVSAYGVHDMAANANEWVDAFFQPYPNNRTPVPEFGQNYRVFRGANFSPNVTIDDARTTRRSYAEPKFTAQAKVERAWLIGFRCAISADDPRLKEFLSKKGSTR